MSIIDYLIFGLYMAGVLAVGFYHFRRNSDVEDYYVGGRSMGSFHIGLSIVATDVGGGFSIGLGGLGFVMGLSGSWLLFTGLIGAWFSAVFLIPRIKRLDAEHGMRTYPDFLRYRYGEKVALLAALISGIGYMGFTGAQILAGAKLASVTIIPEAPWGMDSKQFAILIIAVITIVYTVAGGLKAVIYTDTIQWIVLLGGLILVTFPVTLSKLGGWEKVIAQLPPHFMNPLWIDPVTLINWFVTIIPIWLIGMTLYQRMFACRGEKEAKRAWFIAGIFEYPLMAFSGVVLGMFARVLFPEAESEMGLPLLIKHILPVGVTGIVIASYFSAIMSTADSCLMASSGNFAGDLLQRYWFRQTSEKRLIGLSQAVTLLVGVVAVVIASRFEKVLDAILYAYAFMVSGLFVPTLGAYFWKSASSTGAFWAMLLGGSFTIFLQLGKRSLPDIMANIGLDASCYGITLSAIVFISFSLIFPDRRTD
ncbi:MAG: sodium:solute symporter family protein [Candidatus Glassbacteria bacterium]|nr:sodium:solute symporter family protein [Candidatus Glassbacteria bacterium]